MGNFYNISQSQNINQTQLSTVNQSCGEAAKSTIDDVTITIIDSHVGDIEISNSLVVGNMDCVLNAISTSQITDVSNQVSASEQKSLIFQISANQVQAEQDINLWSLQESIINQSCTQTVEDVTKEVVFTIIDSTTGNIRVANNAIVQSFNCNLTSATYQIASADLGQSSSSKQSTSCCGFDLAMIIPLVIGVVAVIVISKVLPSKHGDSSGGGVDPVIQDALAASSLSNALTKERQARSYPQAPPKSQAMSSSQVKVLPSRILSQAR